MDRDVVDELAALLRLDVDAGYAYERAIEAVDDAEVRSALVAFRQDHALHVEALTAALRRLGAIPPPRVSDASGAIIEALTAVRGITGTIGALRAMRSNEQLTNRGYERALELRLDPETRAVVERGRGDEARHLEWIEDEVRRRGGSLWPASEAVEAMSSPVRTAGRAARAAVLGMALTGASAVLVGLALMNGAASPSRKPARTSSSRPGASSRSSRGFAGR